MGVHAVLISGSLLRARGRGYMRNSAKPGMLPRAEIYESYALAQ